MKPLSYTQKKWAMATLLLGALTFNLSMHTPSEVSQADLASSEDQVEAILPTAQGSVKVKYIKNGDEVMAVVPKTIEGKTCDACGKSYNLPIAFDKNKDDINSLHSALLKHISAKSKDKSDENEESKSDDDSKETKEQQARERKNKRDKEEFARGMKFCKDEERAEKASCLIDSFLEVIGRKESSEKSRISKEVALEVFRKEVEPKIAAALTASAAYNEYYERQQLQKDLQVILLALDKLKSNLPGEQNNVRSRVIAVEKDVIRMRTLALKNTLERVKANPKDYAMQSQAEFEIEIARYLGDSMESMNNPLASVNRQAINGQLLQSLKNAVSTNRITATEALDLYSKEYSNTVSAIVGSMTKAYRFQNGQTVVDPAQLILENAGISSYNPRLNIPQTSVITRAPLAPGVLDGRVSTNPQFQGLPSNRGSFRGQ